MAVYTVIPEDVAASVEAHAKALAEACRRYRFVDGDRADIVAMISTHKELLDRDYATFVKMTAP